MVKLELSWAGQPTTVQILKDLVLSKKPNFVFLMKTLIDADKVELLRDMLGYADCRELCG